MMVKTRSTSYVIPPQRAVWMPAGIEHSIEARSIVKMRTLYFDPVVTSGLPSEVCILQITSLLRELIIEAACSELDYEAHSPMARIMAVILDQIRVQPALSSLALPVPTEPRLLHIVQALIDNPADARELADWGSDSGCQ